MSDEPVATLTAKGNSYQVDVLPLDAHFLFRDVTTGGELRGDITVSHGSHHLFRTTSTLTLAGRDKIAKTAAEMDGGYDEENGPKWRLAVFAAVEKVIDAEERAGESADLRFAEEADSDDSMLVDRIFPDAATVMVSPNGTGKSTIARALMLSIASGREVIPGCKPRVTGPVLYVAGEDAVLKYHARHLAALCRGLGIEREEVKNSIRMYSTGGRPLAQIARTIGEQAYDCQAVVLDSHESLLSRLGQNGAIREQAAAYWNAVDQIGKPSFTVSHPNREDRKNWNSSEGSMAGAEVNSDRMRCAWKLLWQDDNDDFMKVKRRKYTLENTKWSHGEPLPEVSFAVEHWRDGAGLEVHRFVVSNRVVNNSVPRSAGRPATAFSETRDAFNAGATTPELLAKALDISYDSARMRLNRFKKDLLGDGE